MNATDLAIEIMGCSDNRLSVSHYFEMPNNGLLRVSNHLPKVYNLQENNEGVKRIFLMFTDSVTEQEVENSAVIEEIEAIVELIKA